MLGTFGFPTHFRRTLDEYASIAVHRRRLAGNSV